MKGLLIAGCTGLALAGCAGTSLIDNIAATEATVQQITLAVCQVVPTATSIASLIAVGDPLLGTASAIANMICKAVQGLPVSVATPVSKRLGGRLYGKFVPSSVVIDGKTVTFQ